MLLLHSKRQKMAESLKDKTAKGLFWGAMNSGSTQVLNILFGIFLARLLSPSDYGVIGVLTIFTVIAGNLQSSGFTQALVNLEKPTHRDYNSVFWFNIIVSFSIYVVLFFCAPLIAAFFHQPCLVWLSRFVFLAFFISSFGIVQNAYMSKNLMNKEIAIVSFVALISSCVIGLVLALLGFAYWSLAWQQVVYIAVLNFGRYYYTGWRPSLDMDFVLWLHGLRLQVQQKKTRCFGFVSRSAHPPSSAPPGKPLSAPERSPSRSFALPLLPWTVPFPREDPTSGFQGGFAWSVPYDDFLPCFSRRFCSKRQRPV